MSPQVGASPPWVHPRRGCGTGGTPRRSRSRSAPPATTQPLYAAAAAVIFQSLLCVVVVAETQIAATANRTKTNRPVCGSAVSRYSCGGRKPGLEFRGHERRRTLDTSTAQSVGLGVVGSSGVQHCAAFDEPKSYYCIKL